MGALPNGVVHRILQELRMSYERLMQGTRALTRVLNRLIVGVIRHALPQLELTHQKLND